jgi:hypothetical protein
MLRYLRTSLAVLRPRALVRTQKSVDKLVAETQEVRRALTQLADDQRQLHAASGDLRASIESVAGDVRSMHQQVRTLIHRESQLRAIVRSDTELEEALSRAAFVCDEARLAKHIEAAVGAAELHLDPFPYIVVQRVFPEAFYQSLIRAIPPVELFGDKPLNKQHLKVPFDLAPAYSRRIWGFFARLAAPHILQPVLVEKFREPMRQWIVSNWPSLAADPFGPPMEMNTGDGRMLLRGRGYRIRPHRDPKWGFLTCLLYLAREDDSEAWGTQLYWVDNDRPAQGAAPHWIDARDCRVAAEIPFRRNTLLVFLNSTGAHGAHIPEDAEPADLRRYAYQWRIGPNGKAIRALMAALPDEKAVLWAGKRSGY